MAGRLEFGGYTLFVQGSTFLDGIRQPAKENTQCIFSFTDGPLINWYGGCCNFLLNLGLVYIKLGNNAIVKTQLDNFERLKP